MSKLEGIVRPAAPGDAAAIADLISHLSYPTTARQMAARLERIAADKAYATFVTVENNRILGVVGACLCPLYESDVPAGRILALSVDPAARGRGIGAALVERAEAWFKAQGAESAIVNSGQQRREARRFYERLGYAATGLRYKKKLVL